MCESLCICLGRVQKRKKLRFRIDFDVVSDCFLTKCSLPCALGTFLFCVYYRLWGGKVITDDILYIPVKFSSLGDRGKKCTVLATPSLFSPLCCMWNCVPVEIISISLITSSHLISVIVNLYLEFLRPSHLPLRYILPHQEQQRSKFTFNLLPWIFPYFTILHIYSSYM